MEMNKPTPDGTVTRLLVPMCDKGRSQLLERVFPVAFKFIDETLANNKKHTAETTETKDNEQQKVLIHCCLGVNRSAAVTVGYVMRHLKMTLKDAHALVAAKRPQMCIHDSYMNQLREYDYKLHNAFSTKPNELPTSLTVYRLALQRKEAPNQKGEMQGTEKIKKKMDTESKDTKTVEN